MIDSSINSFLSVGQNGFAEITHGSLCSGGIDGMAEGAKRAGIKTIWNCEINEFARKLLKQEYPEAKQYKDVYTDDQLWDLSAWVLYLRGLHNGVYSASNPPIPVIQQTEVQN